MSNTKRSGSDRLPIVGRGAQINPANRFQPIRIEDEFEQVEHDQDFIDGQRQPRTEYYSDDTQSIVNRNDSPDLPFTYSLNAYRGCAHGCAYCYARPTHEYLGLSAGVDFESKIFVKERAPELLRLFLASSRYQPEPIMMSGVTDCYQPAERHFRLSRGCLEVALAARQPITITTKNALVIRDIDLLQQLAALRLTRVAVSITSLDKSLIRVLEPRTSAPEARLRAIKELTAAGIPVSVMLAPIIPGLNDNEISNILAAAADCGAKTASYTMLRLPLTVEPIFLDWLEQNAPDKRERIANLVRSVRDGRMNDSNFGSRMRGTGIMADQIQSLFGILKKKWKLDHELIPLDVSNFQPPCDPNGQLKLF